MTDKYARHNSPFHRILPVLQLFLALCWGLDGQAQFRPHQELGDLFKAVQVAPVFPDSKTFPDCVPRSAPAEILRAYAQEKDKPGFDLKAFVLRHFELPPTPGNDYQADTSQPVTDHIQALWPVLTRQPQQQKGSLLALPHAYVVPGGRFREIYYWDSYFTMLGLQESQQTQLIQNMVDNFAFLIETVGHIPNGNRTYYVSRSQPPFFALMLRVLAQQKGQQILSTYAPALEKEYAFWMDGAQNLTAQKPAFRRVVLLPDGNVLNRYWDDDPSPRPEAYKEDLEVARASGRNPEEVFRNIRAAAESGWDFSSRWFLDGKSLESIRTTELVPVDLNALLYHVEVLLADMAHLRQDKDQERAYRAKAEKRKKALLAYCWNPTEQFFFDYDFVRQKLSTHPTLAAVTPLFFCMATKAQARGVARKLERDFLRQGGLPATLVASGQQWDAPNGWAPLQWMSIQGLKAYGQNKLASTIAWNWVNQNLQVYKQTGKLTEKYNVEKPATQGGGGEYPNQDGFGWTNGVLLKLIKQQQRK
ncbi:alpha,alpha-trehalase TreF [Rufibacter radiotolerans]|uniref:alpha,alpha-trehalase TreF n=1 Tax=Rufibacter radiotolerans TaxID=1379910 RepID=UPI0009E3894B|nr:alpha,alpha-trehalase TreF [Rufibacter radiotolerans]